MKHYLLLATLCATFLFSNCKKDDPDPVVTKTPQELIIGKWNVTKALLLGFNFIENTAETQYVEEYNFSTGGTFTYKATNTDKTVTPAAVETSTANGTYSWSGNNLTMNYTIDGEAVTASGTATVTEQKWVFTITNSNTLFFSLIEADKI